MQNTDIKITRLFSQGATSLPGQADHYVWKVYSTKNAKQRVITAKFATGHVNRIVYNPLVEEFRPALERAINNGQPLETEEL